MNPWRSLLRAIEAELDRCSQEVAGQRVLPNAVDVALPSSQFGPWKPILEAVTAEVGEALVAWAGERKRSWYADEGPYLTVRVEDRPRPDIACDFRKGPPE